MQVFSVHQLGALSLFSQFQIYFVFWSPFDCDTGEAEKEKKKKKERDTDFAASADVC